MFGLVTDVSQYYRVWTKETAVPCPMESANMWLWNFNDTWLSSLSPEERSTLQHLQSKMLYNFSDHSIDDPEFDLLRQPGWRGLIVSLYVAVIAAGIVGNVIVVYVVARNKSMQNITNVFIANLAVSDIFLCAISLPIQLYYQLTDHWLFGDVMCRIMFAAFAVPVYMSSLTILLIAFDRYWLILCPLRNRMSMRTALILMMVNITVSTALAVPVMCFTTLHVLDHPDLRIHRHYCKEVWPSTLERNIYTVFTFVGQFCMPLILTAFLYFKIFWRLKMRPCVRNEERKQRTNKILVSIVALFILCWLPWNTYTVITELAPQIVKGMHYKFVDLMLKLFALSSACVNPFLYCWLNDNFRKELDSMVFKMKLFRNSNSQSRQNRQNYRLQVTVPEDNGRTTTDPYNNTIVTIERTSRFSTSNIHCPEQIYKPRCSNGLLAV
jgi:neuropeptide Y receptor